MTAVVWHLLRGLGAAALVAAALLPPSGPSWVTFLLLPPAMLLLRGCPMCWLLGLAERLRALSTQRGCLMPYQDPSDFRLLPEMIRLASPEAEAFFAFDKVVGRSDGAIPPKYREIIALAVALTTQCAYCLDVHTGRALEAGATREELAEVAFIAASLRAGAALGHGLMMLRLAEEGGRANRAAPE